MPLWNWWGYCGSPFTYFFLSWGTSASVCLGSSPMPSHGHFIFFVHVSWMLSIGGLVLQGVLLRLELESSSFYKSIFYFCFINLFFNFNALCSLMIKFPPICWMGAFAGQFLKKIWRYLHEFWMLPYFLAQIIWTLLAPGLLPTSRSTQWRELTSKYLKN